MQKLKKITGASTDKANSIKQKVSLTKWLYTNTFLGKLISSSKNIL